MIRLWSTTTQNLRQNFDKSLSIMIRFKKMLLTGTLLVLCIWKPHALFMFLGLVQTLMNISMNIFVDITVGAAVYVHNLLNL